MKRKMRYILAFFCLLLIDFFAFSVSLFVAYAIRVYIAEPLGLADRFQQTVFDVFGLVAMFPILAVVFLYEGLYTKREPLWDEMGRIIKGIFISFAIIFSFYVMTKSSDELSRSVILMAIVIAFLLLPLFRYFGKILLLDVGLYAKNVLCIGSHDDIERVRQALSKERNMGLVVSTTLLVEEANLIKQTVKKQKLDTAIIISNDGSTGMDEVTNKCYYAGLDVMTIADFGDAPVKNLEVHYLFSGRMLLLSTKNTLQNKSMRLAKTVFDIVLSILLLPFLLCLIAVISLAIYMESGGPIFFRQNRVGQHNKTFRIFKFRTMYKDAETRLEKILATCPKSADEWRHSYKLKNDPRVTKVGLFLRKTSLDELPQIFNVLKGEMSLVGPRPVVKKELRDYYKGYAKYYIMTKPGVTGLWQVEGRSDTTYEFRVKIDSWYILNWSLWQDVVILIKTVRAVLVARGAY